MMHLRCISFVNLVLRVYAFKRFYANSVVKVYIIKRSHCRYFSRLRLFAKVLVLYINIHKAYSNGFIFP